MRPVGPHKEAKRLVAFAAFEPFDGFWNGNVLMVVEVAGRIEGDEEVSRRIDAEEDGGEEPEAVWSGRRPKGR